VNRLHPRLRAQTPTAHARTQENDFVLWESNAITQYSHRDIGRRTAADKARPLAHVNQWQCWELAHWLPPLRIDREKVKSSPREQPNLGELYEGERLFHTCAELLDKHLRARTSSACGRLTVADFSLGPGSSANAPSIRWNHIPKSSAGINRWDASPAGSMRVRNPKHSCKPWGLAV